MGPSSRSRPFPVHRELVADGRVSYDPDEAATRIDGRRGYYQLGEGVVDADADADTDADAGADD